MVCDAGVRMRELRSAVGVRQMRRARGLQCSRSLFSALRFERLGVGRLHSSRPALRVDMVASLLSFCALRESAVIDCALLCALYGVLHCMMCMFRPPPSPSPSRRPAIVPFGLLVSKVNSACLVHACVELRGSGQTFINASVSFNAYSARVEALRLVSSLLPYTPTRDRQPSLSTGQMYH